MGWINVLTHRFTNKVSNYIQSIILVAGRLVGIQRINPDKADSSKLVTAGWIFILGIPVGLILLGPEFPMLIWLSIVLGLLMLVNLDDSLILMSNIINNGLKATLQTI